MEVKTFCHNNPLQEITIQVLQTTCPKCGKPVQFSLQEDDKLWKKDAEYHIERCQQQAQEIRRLNEVIGKILNLQSRPSELVQPEQIKKAGGQ